jgi:iron complex transport system substrate-binding protein
MRKKLLILVLAFGFILSACTSAPSPTDAPEDNQTEIIEAADPTALPVADPTAEKEVVEEPAEESDLEMMVFSDDIGQTVSFSDYPQAIVSLSPSTTEILFAIGAGGQVIGREEFSIYPEEALEVASIGSMWGEMPVEAILALEPDLVVAAQIISEEQVQSLVDLGLQVYWQANPADFDGLYKNLMDFAVLTGHESEAEALVTDLAARVSYVQDTVSAYDYEPSVFYELDGTEPANPWTTGSGTFIDYIIGLAGGSNAASALQGDYAQISAEELIVEDPDVILLGDAVYGTTPKSVAERPGWDAIKAVQTGSILPIDPNTLSVPGPRLVDGLEAIAAAIHPVVLDGRGTSFYVTEPYQKIVSISPSTTEILFAVGAGSQVVGRDEMSLFPEGAIQVESIGSMFGELPVEAILALEPDLVVAAQIVSEEQVLALEDLGLMVFWQANPLDYPGLFSNLTDIAVLTGKRVEAQTLISDLSARVDAVLSAIADVENNPTVFYELDATDPSNPWTTGSGTFIDYIITSAGGINAAAALQGDYAQISSEELLTLNPDVILLADALYGITIESVGERPGWDVIAAVQNEAIFPIDPNMMSVPGPRLVDALEVTAILLHPELFE